MPGGAHYRCALAAAAVLLSLAAALHGQSNEQFAQQYIEVSGKVSSLMVEDLDGDSLKDLLLLHNDYHFESNSYIRFLSLFLQSEGGFHAAPSYTLRADEDEVLVDVAPADDFFDSAQLVTVRPDGIYVRPFTHGHLGENVRRIIDSPSIFWCADPRSLYPWDFCRQLSITPGLELLLPKPEQLEVYRRMADGDYRIFKAYAYKTDLRFGRNRDTAADLLPLSASFALSQFEWGDFNGDGLDDLAIIRDDAVALYFTKADSCKLRNELAAVHPDLQFLLGAMTLDERQRHGRNSPSLAVTTGYLNADQLADIVLFKRNSGELFNAMSQLQLFLNRGGRFDTIPDRIFTIGSSEGEPCLWDFNGDGLIDVAFITSKLSLLALPKLILSRKIDCTLSLFYMQPPGVFSAEPDERTTLSYNVNLNEILPSSPLQHLHGDYNGDGKLDLLMETGVEEISIYWGRKRGIFDKKTYVQYRTKTSPLFMVTDLNSDLKSDILFWYGDDTNHLGTVNVLISR